jgi:hypothetical protein
MRCRRQIPDTNDKFIHVDYCTPDEFFYQTSARQVADVLLILPEDDFVGVVANRKEELLGFQVVSATLNVGMWLAVTVSSVPHHLGSRPVGAHPSGGWADGIAATVY